MLKELESWNYALQVDIHVHQWFFAFPCQSSKKHSILGHKGISKSQFLSQKNTMFIISSN
jgi:hypothetical protein